MTNDEADKGRFEQDVQPLIPTREPGPIEVGKVFRGAYFNWSQAGFGFGELSFEADDDGKIICYSETLGREWVRTALYALADHVADTADFDDYPECTKNPAACPESAKDGCCMRQPEPASPTAA